MVSKSNPTKLPRVLLRTDESLNFLGLSDMYNIDSSLEGCITILHSSMAQSVVIGSKCCYQLKYLTVLKVRAPLWVNLPSCVHTTFHEANIRNLAYLLQYKPGVPSPIASNHSSDPSGKIPHLDD